MSLVSFFHGDGEALNCDTCTIKDCKICPLAGKDPSVMELNDSYRRISKGYYSSTIIEVHDDSGKVIGHSYNKIGE